MFACQRVPNLCLMWDYCVNSRLMKTAAKGVITQPSKRKKKTQKKKSDFSGFYKKERKLIREKLLMATKGTSKSHVYKNLYPWESSKELAECLRNTEVYNKDGLIALSKPYGIAQKNLSKTTSAESQTIVETVNSGSTPAHTPAMSQVLAHLKKLYAVDHLEIVKSTERWSSGLMLLSTSSKVTEKVQMSFRRSRALAQPAITYRIVTVGLPTPASIITKVATKLEYVHNVGNVPVIVKKFSQTSANLQKVKSVRVEHKALAYNKELDTSLLEVKTQVSKWHFLRVWLSYCYSPILGDNLYSGRVKTLCRRKIQVSPHNVSHESQHLPDTIYSQLALPPKSSELIPCHIHSSEITLNQFNTDKSDLVISATPPEHFMWTCRQLGLVLNEEEITEGESSERAPQG